MSACTEATLTSLRRSFFLSFRSDTLSLVCAYGSGRSPFFLYFLCVRTVVLLLIAASGKQQQSRLPCYKEQAALAAACKAAGSERKAVQPSRAWEQARKIRIPFRNPEAGGLCPILPGLSTRFGAGGHSVPCALALASPFQLRLLDILKQLLQFTMASKTGRIFQMA